VPRRAIKLESCNEFLERLKEIAAFGYQKTHRIGDTGIGKTLEDWRYGR
jgi:hypothetical protein